MATKLIVATYDAVGGPRVPIKGGDGLTMGPTDQGNYVMAYCGRHTSPTYRYWSRIPWGASLKEEKGVLKVFVKGRWQPLRNFTPATKNEILDRHEALYGVRKVPPKWVFNDFGHMTCKFFRDKNRNRRLDAGEKIHPEYIHTTPDDEAQSAMGAPVILVESHGCVHVKPKDIDEMGKKGYLKAGNSVIVHKYTETAPVAPVGAGKAPYEVHFFPGSKKIVVKGRK